MHEGDKLLRAVQVNFIPLLSSGALSTDAIGCILVSASASPTG